MAFPTHICRFRYSIRDHDGRPIRPARHQAQPPGRGATASAATGTGGPTRREHTSPVDARERAGGLGVPGTDAVGVVLPPLLNELAELDRRIVLVLEDYPLIQSPAVHEGLAFF